jgi:multiple sugar transport system substrate-binding protein
VAKPRTYLKASTTLVAMAAMITAAACGGGGSGSPGTVNSAKSDIQKGQVGEKLDLSKLSPDVPEPGSPTTVTFETWNTPQSSPIMKSLVTQFQQIHPNIKIQFQSVSPDSATDKLSTQIAGGNPPDVAFMDLSAVGDFARRNALVDLTDYISKSKAVVPDDYVRTFRQNATSNGKMYGLPIDGESTGIFYRKDWFDEAGLKAPTTWQEFEDAAKKMTDPAKKRYGFEIFATESAYYWYPWLWQAGGRLLSPDGGKIEWTSDAGKKAAQFYTGLAKYSPPDYYGSNSYDGRTAFETGHVAMYEAGAWFAGVLMDEAPKLTGKWAAAPMPQDEKCATTVAGDALVMLSGGHNQDAAWKWVEYLSAPQNMALWNVGTKENPATLLPPRTSLLKDPKTFENNPLMKSFAQQLACGVTNDQNNDNWGKVEQDILNTELGKAIYGKQSSDQALQNAADQAKSLIDEGVRK